MSALAGLRILELTQVMAGPFCGQVLADMGADVVKIEPPDGRLDARVARRRGAFLAVNRNKRSLVLDLKSAEHQAVLHRLVRRRRRAARELPARRRGAARRGLGDAVASSTRG